MSRFYIRSTSFLAMLFLCVSFAWATTWYVDASRPDDSGPGTSLATAWKVIQTGVDNAADGDLLLVAPGVYDQGGVYYESVTNRVYIDKAIRLQAISTNPADTVIVGAPDPISGTTGTNAVRCVFMDDGSSLIGFTITNGYSGLDTYGGRGGGIMSRGETNMVSNCWVVGNTAMQGGGVSPHRSSKGGKVFNCIIWDNEADRGAGAGSRIENTQMALINCQIKNNVGRGVQTITVINCMVTGNGGEGVYNCIAVSCVVTGQTGIGGGIYGGEAINCTVAGNQIGHAAYGAVDNHTQFFNSISWGNYYGANYNYNNLSRVDTNDVQYSCIGTNFDAGTYDGPTNVFVYVTQGSGHNTIDDPLYTDPGGDFTLDRRHSPCIDAGNNFYILTVISNYPEAAFDMNGNPRIDTIHGVVDMGAYEYEPPPPGSVMSFF